MSTPLSDLLSLVAAHGKSQASAFLQGEAVIAGSPDQEIWEHLARHDILWDGLTVADQDQIRDAYLEAFKQECARRLPPSDPVTSPLPVPVPSPASSVVPAPLVPDAVKVAQDGSVCEVEPLGEIQKNGDLSFYDESGDELYISKHNQNIVIGAESGASMERAHVRSLIAHLTAWLHTGSFDLKGLPSSAPSSEDTELLDWLEAQSKASSTGISFDYVRYVEDGQVLEKGYRFMRRHFLGERKDTLRAAIRAARAKETQQASTTTQKGRQPGTGPQDYPSSAFFC